MTGTEKLIDAKTTYRLTLSDAFQEECAGINAPLFQRLKSIPRSHQPVLLSKDEANVVLARVHAELNQTTHATPTSRLGAWIGVRRQLKNQGLIYEPYHRYDGMS